ncbi:hypothetical protein DID88_003438 [Monilinia fructigena]|uniref:Chromodomain-helicase-DNA-binding protein 1-like C-terminal domain-containing protein n=1 Tax=Monilinia fructigena TaxID=38457 RepID=A0A395IVB0_9HELO|nr:hypothetical protein DID88_003438 [Monilinia fructigena]
MEDRGEELVKEARLVGRDEDLMKATLKALTEESSRRLKEENERVDALERAANKPLTKKDRKAVLFDYSGVKRVNAETIMERPGEMRMLRTVLENCPDFKTFRVPDASKGAHYSCEWGAKEDGMLLVGIHRHGYGAWTQIRDDTDLGLGDKLFLEEHRVDKKEERSKADEKVAKAPGAVHLVRRADYLLSVLKAKYSDNQAAKRAVENHHRNNKKHERNGSRRSETRGSVSASPAPPIKKASRPFDHNSRDRERERERDRARGHSLNNSRDSRRESGEHGSSTPGLKRKYSDGDDEKHAERRPKFRKSDNGEPDQNDMLRKLFKPIRENLRRLQAGTAKNISNKKKRAGILKEELYNTGGFIDSITMPRKDGSVDEKLKDSLWEYVVVNYWPNPGQSVHAVRPCIAKSDRQS